jgi:hypothetical protein
VAQYYVCLSLRRYVHGQLVQLLDNKAVQELQAFVEDQQELLSENLEASLKPTRDRWGGLQERYETAIT